MSMVEKVNEIDETVKLYGVSTGNGNDGVSHLHPNYFVYTNQPYRLAKAAMIDQFEGAAGKAWALANVEVDGEAEFGITAAIDNPPEEDGAESHNEDETWSGVNGAWLLLHVFPVAEDDAHSQLINIYASIEAALTPSALALVPSDD